MTKRAVAVRHVGFEDLGTLAPWLVKDGYDIEVLDAGMHDLSLIDARPCDLKETPGGTGQTIGYPWKY
jgi:GMP synthase (glutamine-hydrolysing)